MAASYVLAYVYMLTLGTRLSIKKCGDWQRSEAGVDRNVWGARRQSLLKVII